MSISCTQHQGFIHHLLVEEPFGRETRYSHPDRLRVTLPMHYQVGCRALIHRERESPSRKINKSITMITHCTILGVNSPPDIRVDIPLLSMNTILKLDVLFKRVSPHGRFEVLDCSRSSYRVVASEVSWAGPPRQLLTLEALQGSPPTWRSVKRPPEPTLAGWRSKFSVRHVDGSIPPKAGP